MMSIKVSTIVKVKMTKSKNYKTQQLEKQINKVSITPCVAIVFPYI